MSLRIALFTRDVTLTLSVLSVYHPLSDACMVQFKILVYFFFVCQFFPVINPHLFSRKIISSGKTHFQRSTFSFHSHFIPYHSSLPPSPEISTGTYYTLWLSQLPILLSPPITLLLLPTVSAYHLLSVPSVSSLCYIIISFTCYQLQCTYT